MALKVLNDYYSKSDKAHSSSDGASTGIISLLEVCESDFSKALAEMTAEEGTAAAAYDMETKENEIMKVTKKQDVKYKTKESNGLDKSVAESSSDKAETYAERKERRTAEIEGLKNALQILENETALIQQTSRRFLRLRRHQ